MDSSEGESRISGGAINRRVHVLELIGNAIIGGMESTVFNLIQALPASEFEVTCICPYESPFTARLRALGCKVFITHIRDDPTWSSIELVSTIVQHHAIDIIHAHLLNAHTLAAIGGRMTGIPVLATIHSMALLAQEISVARVAGSHLITVCQQAFAQALATGIAPQNISIIPNGVDVERFRPVAEPRALRADLGLSAAMALVGFVGRLAPEKGPDKFVLAADRVCQDRQDVHFALIGEGPERGMLEAMIARTSAPDRIHLLGAMQSTEQVYPAFDILLQTSRSEAMPLAVLEAMACGVPVVALAVGGVAEIIEADSTGIHISPIDPPGVLSSYAGDWPGIAHATSDLLANTKRCRQMGLAGRKRAVELFKLEQNTVETAALFRRLAVSRNRPIGVKAVGSEGKMSKASLPNRLQKVG
ncbi:MAG: glycosyltransferase family 1 protein [Rhodospirillales bacterium]|nr:glycosyltransferase family 1 protein [Rhodospirillales bacterium]